MVEIPEHLRQYMVQGKPGRLAKATEAGFMECDWPGLYRMARARRDAGLPLDDLDVEAIARAEAT